MGDIFRKKYTSCLAQKGKSLSEGSPASKLSPSARQQRIQELVEKCGDHVPEADLIAHMSTRMPKILRGEAGALDVMLEDGRLTKMYEHGFSHLAAYTQLTNVVKLMAHKEPRLKILEIGAGTGGATKPMLEALQASSVVPRYTHYTFTDITTAFLGAAQDKFQGFKNMDFRVLDIEKDPLSQGFETGTYDIVLASNVIHATKSITKTLEHCRILLKPDGRIIIIETTRDRVPITYLLGPLPGFWQGEDDGRVETPFLSKEAWNNRLLRAGFSGTSILLDDYAGDISSNSIIVSNVEQEPKATSTKSEKLWLVCRQTPHPIVMEIEAQAKDRGIETQVISLTEIRGNVLKGDRILMLAELEGPLLAKMTKQDMDAVKALFKTASSAIWVTYGGLLKGKKPEHSLIFGIAKSIMTEQPSIRVSSVDLDPDDGDNARSADVIVQHELNLREDHDRLLDTELIVDNGMVYISRYIVDPIDNHDFTRQLKPSPEMLQLSGNLELAFQQVGRVDSFYFKDKPFNVANLREDEILLTPTVYNLGKREAAILKGLQDAEHFSHICVAIVKEVGAVAMKFKAGQRVVCFSPGKFDSSFITSEATCELIRPSDNAEDLVSSLLPYCTALYALSNLGHATKGQTVLVHRVSDPRHVAAVRLAQLLGCNTIITFNSEEKQILFHRKYPELDGCNSYVASSGLARRLNISTAGRGIDVAIASPGSPDLPEAWISLAKNGRFICMGDSDVPNLGLFDPSVFGKGASFISFNMLDMIKTQVEEMGKLVRRIIILLRDETIFMFTSEAEFDVSELPTAVGVASQWDITSSVVLTYGPESVAPIHLAYKPVEFPPTTSYLLIGCLGGLGRSLVTWMLARGARHFIFLSRSGADKPEAARLVKELEGIALKSKKDMTITIVRGDVAKRTDVDRAISMAKTPIRGVMQQAMFLKDDLFDNMSLETWQGVLDPKVQGSINLHEALINEPLDFFVMTSSVLGAIGAATQSNYAAANAFLDHMARHRWSLGLEACSIALGMIVEVGHVEAHPEVEEALRRNGVYGIPEDEYLKMMEISCRRRDASRVSWDWDRWALSHVLTGMESGKISMVGGKSLWLQDNRVRNLVMAIAGMEGQTRSSSSGDGVTQTSITLRAAAEANGEAGVKDAVQDLVLLRFSKLVLVPTEKLAASLTRPLASFGMDSMITAELRSWAWRELKADIPFMALLEGGMLISGLIDIVCEKMDHSIWKD